MGNAAGKTKKVRQSSLTPLSPLQPPPAAPIAAPSSPPVAPPPEVTVVAPEEEAQVTKDAETRCASDVLTDYSSKLTLEEFSKLKSNWFSYAQTPLGVTRSDFTRLIRSEIPNLTSELADKLFTLYDVNHDGHISQTEFLFAMALRLHGSQRDNNLAMFYALDANGDGKLTKDELRAQVTAAVGGVLNSVTTAMPYSKAELDKDCAEMLDEVFKILDADGSGFIDQEEFVNGMAKADTAQAYVRLRDRLQNIVNIDAPVYNMVDKYPAPAS